MSEITEVTAVVEDAVPAVVAALLGRVLQPKIGDSKAAAKKRHKRKISRAARRRNRM